LGSSASPPGKISPSHWAKGVLIFGLEVQAVGRTHLENFPTKVSYQRRVSYDLVNDSWLPEEGTISPEIDGISPFFFDAKIYFWPLIANSEWKNPGQCLMPKCKILDPPQERSVNVWPT
jgi:hypothetical protein